MTKIGVIQYGLGPIGSEIARLVVRRKGLELVGGLDIDPAKVGKDVGQVIGLGRPLGLVISDDPRAVLARAGAEVVLHSTGSHLEQIYPQLAEIIEASLSVISTSEELAYPWAQHPDLAEKLDQLAREHGVTVLGTGVNPGFIMDTLSIVLSGVCQEVRRVMAKRVVDAAKRRLRLQQKVGAGLSVEEFEERVRAGTVRHVGLTESVALIADALGWQLDAIEETIEPVVAERPVRSEFIAVEAGQVAGVRQMGWGLKDGQAAIVLDLRVYLGAPEGEGDSILIEGTPQVEMTVRGVHGDLATAAMVVNAIPRVLAAPPGLMTMKDLPPVCAYHQMGRLIGPRASRTSPPGGRKPPPSGARGRIDRLGAST